MQYLSDKLPFFQTSGATGHAVREESCKLLVQLAVCVSTTMPGLAARFNQHGFSVLDLMDISRTWLASLFAGHFPADVSWRVLDMVLVRAVRSESTKAMPIASVALGPLLGLLHDKSATLEAWSLEGSMASSESFFDVIVALPYSCKSKKVHPRRSELLSFSKSIDSQGGMGLAGAEAPAVIIITIINITPCNSYVIINNHNHQGPSPAFSAPRQPRAV